MDAPPIGKRGERIADRYELRAERFDCGLGEAWTAADLAGGGGMAVLKLLPAGVRAAEPWGTAVERLRKLSHPTIVNVLDGGETRDGRRWIRIEPVEGRSLQDRLADHRAANTAPGLGVVVQLFDQVSRALHVGVLQGGRSPVLHRGLSPRSVLLKPRGVTARLLDHELVRYLGAPASWDYLAPEQDGSGDHEAATTDVFALAVLLLELLTLRATPTTSSKETWRELARREPKQVKAAVAALRGGMPAGFWAVVSQALQVDGRRRPPDAREFARALRQAMPETWRSLPASEPDPPARGVAWAPSASGGRRAAAGVPEGWQAAERAPLHPARSPPLAPAEPVTERPPPVVPSSDGGLVSLLDGGAATLVDEGEGTIVEAPPPDDATGVVGDDLGAATFLDARPARGAIVAPRRRAPALRDALPPQDLFAAELASAPPMSSGASSTRASARASGESAFGRDDAAPPRPYAIACPSDEDATVSSKAGGDQTLPLAPSWPLPLSEDADQTLARPTPTPCVQPTLIHPQAIDVTRPMHPEAPWVPSAFVTRAPTPPAPLPPSPPPRPAGLWPVVVVAVALVMVVAAVVLLW